MPTTIVNKQVDNLRQYTDRNMVVRADRDHFRVSSSNPFKRLIVWTQAKLLPASQTQQITEARARFIDAIGNRYGSEGGAVARDVLGANSRKPLRSRDIGQVFDTLDQIRAGQPPPAQRAPATSGASVPGPGDPPVAKSATPATTEHPAVSLAAAQDSAIGGGPSGGPADDPPEPLENDPVSQEEQFYTPAANPVDDPPAAAAAAIDPAEANVQGDPVSQEEQFYTPAANPVDDPPTAAAAAIDPAEANVQGDPVSQEEQFYTPAANPVDDPPTAAAAAIDPAEANVQGEPDADPLLEPYLNAGISTEHAQPLLAAGIPADQALQFRVDIDQRGDDPEEVFQSGLPLERLRMAYRQGLDLDTAHLLHDAKLLHPFIVRDIYGTHQIPITEDTLIRFSDLSVSQEPKAFGRGSTSTVYKVGYNDGKFRIFKPLAPPDPSGHQPFGWSAREIGIDRHNQRIAVRNIATCRLAKALGFDVVAQTQLGLHTLQGAAPGAPAQLGLVMELAPGKAALDYKAEDNAVFELPEVRRDLTKLQLLDCLTAQGDRHAGNYFIDVRPDGGVRVTGIDNDQCLGPKVHNPDQIRRGPRNGPSWGYRSCGLPPVVDTDMVEAVLAMSPEKIRSLLGDILPPGEVEATVQRLNAIQDHIVGLEPLDRIIDPDGWADARVYEHTNFTNSYFARESATNAGIAAFGDEKAALDAMGF